MLISFSWMAVAYPPAFVYYKTATPAFVNKKYRGTMQRSQRLGILGLTFGIIFGFMLCMWSKPLPCITQSECCMRLQLKKEIISEMSLNTPAQDKATSKKQVLIGVMTALNYIDSRALAVWKSWAQNINGDVIFFSSAETKQQLGLPIVALPGIDDSYPPQKKSFMLVKYLHDFGLDKYEYFMRVDDDVYIHGDRLSKFLAQLNNSEPLFIGQAGLGNSAEVGQLSLGPGENFCMGGPGIIFSAETLRRMVPHISYCLQNLLTTHEDVELGRCVRMFAGTSCTWNYEVQKLFFHSYTYQTDKNAFPYDITKAPLDEAITFHPLKTPENMYKLHHELMVKEVSKLEGKKLKIQEELDELSRLYGSKPKSSKTPSTKDNLITWTYINRKHQFEHSSFSVKRNILVQWKQILNEAFISTKRSLNNIYAKKGYATDLSLMTLNHGFLRFYPLKGIQVSLNMGIKLSKFKGSERNDETFNGTIHMEMPLAAPVIREITSADIPIVHLILPLSGRFRTMQRFLTQFEAVCGMNDFGCDLLVILYDGPEFQITKDLISGSKYRHLITIESGVGNFSRAEALHKGIVNLQGNALLLFIDVDVYFDETALLKTRRHTKNGEQVYFPIVFSQYDSEMVCGSDFCPVDDKSITTGAFRFFGFGIASIYKEDYIKCGGFDLSIRGWGKEDVDLYLKVIKSGLNVFRAPDPGFVHIYHPVICEKSLNSEQATMCLNSKAASYASKRTLANIYAINHNKMFKNR